MHVKKTRRLRWLLLSLFVCLGGLVSFSVILTAVRESSRPLKFAEHTAWALMPLVFSVLAALVISHQPRNPIGWLLMLLSAVDILAAPVDLYLMDVLAPPESPSFLFLATVWFSNWAWVLLIFPLLMILFYFPTGRPLTRRWRWIPAAALGMVIFFITLVTFGEEFVYSTAEEWSVPNPIGFLPLSFWELIITPWILALFAMTAASVVALFLRYRRARPVEREQIKWLVYSCGLFAAVYLLGFIFDMDEEGLYLDIWNLLFALSILGIPASIAIAILKHRLWDIDILIRRTLVYSLLTVSLGLLYFGGVTVLQALFTTFTGQSSPAAMVLSTLAIAAMFHPLRSRIQVTIDRRFYRKKYSVEKTLAAFTESLREEVNLSSLSGRLVEVVEDTFQPEHVSLWLREWEASTGRAEDEISIIHTIVSNRVVIKEVEVV